MVLLILRAKLLTMLKASTETIQSLAIGIALASASTTDAPSQTVPDEGQRIIAEIMMSVSTKQTGDMIFNYKEASEMLSFSQNRLSAVDITSVKRQLRYRNLEENFMLNCGHISKDKRGYIEKLANEVSILPIVDYITSYNEYDESLDTVLKINDGLTLSISQFLDEDLDAPSVFSIHRGSKLLVSDELPISEIIRRYHSVIIKYGNGKMA